MVITGLFLVCVVPLLLGGLGAFIGKAIEKSNPDYTKASLVAGLAGLLVGLIIAAIIISLFMLVVVGTSGPSQL